MDPASAVIAIAGIGLFAGLIGGLTGLGGSIIMLPGLALIVGFADETNVEQHTYMAAGLAVNFMVAVPATWRHQRAGAIRAAIVIRLLPPAGIAMVAGVLLSNRLEPQLLIRMLAVMIAVFVVAGKVGDWAARSSPEAPVDETIRKRSGTLIATGTATGLLAGLLGIGGGIIMVAVLRAVGRLPVRIAIAASSATMCLMVPIGAALKISTLGTHGLDPIDAIRLAGFMGPAAVLGSLVGSSLVHRLPRRAIRIVVDIVLLVAAARLGGLL
ncbi:MAG: sulfite exporter TauE/SafE family protein [Planctomycetota bacterium]